MSDIIAKEQCSGCAACYNICSFDAIVMQADEEGFCYPIIDENKCKKCGACQRVCPALHLRKQEKDLPKAYAGYNTDDAVRMKSTSGGIFSLIAEYVIKQLSGRVYGVVFAENFESVCYRVAETIEEIEEMRGSKYLQADVEMVYRKVEKDLKAGIEVLFSGLPCQVEGLRSYLQGRYNNLCCIDMACLGIPSPMVWRKYLSHVYDSKEIKNIVFKDKVNGWKKWNVKIETEEKTDYSQGLQNPYMKCFIEGLSVRPSCFQCHYKTISRNSDFTIADCWGIGEKNRELNDDKGLSAILVQSEKGLQIWKQIVERIQWQEYNAQELMAGNRGMTKNVTCDGDRKKFFERIRNEEWDGWE